MSIMLHRNKRIRESRTLKQVETKPASIVETEDNAEEVVLIPTRTDIARMNKAELIEQAESVGIDVTDKSGTSLKELLIEYYDL